MAVSQPGSQCPDQREAEIGVIFVASALEKGPAQPWAYVVHANSCMWEEMSQNNSIFTRIYHEIQRGTRQLEWDVRLPSTGLSV